MCWVHHLVRAHSGNSGHDPASLNPERMPLNEAWVSLVSKFLLNRLTVTMWTELSYSYRLSPSIEGLMSLAMYLRDLDLHPVTMEPENGSGRVYRICLRCSCESALGLVKGYALSRRRLSPSPIVIRLPYSEIRR
ncbi:hypothetical protein F5Y08DRAFT_300390 [Xylaria arbuscula]|nr:hypothetical protein F5Y08DRAFT_300390 [Xylaria arbuscula]